ncbi:21260_t:CDS:2, partial [Gigaspora rosea]
YKFENASQDIVHRYNVDDYESRVRNNKFILCVDDDPISLE